MRAKELLIKPITNKNTKINFFINKIPSIAVNSQHAVIIKKGKCGVVRLSDTRFWNTYALINITPHLFSMGNTYRAAISYRYK